MQKFFLVGVGLLLMLGSAGCEYNYAPMDSKDLSAHPLKPLPVDYQAKIWLKLAPTYSHTDLHFSRWDFFVPQPWKEGYLVENHPAGDYSYAWRCDVTVKFLKARHKDEQTHYTFVMKDGNVEQEDMEGPSPTMMLSPNSLLPYTPYDLALDQVGAVTARLPDKSWSVDNHMPGVEPTKGVRSLYFSKEKQDGYDSAVYLVEKLTQFNGWRYEDDAKKPMPIGESAMYYVYAYRGPAAWPNFEKDVMQSLFQPTPDDPGVRIGERPAGAGNEHP